MLAKLKCFGWLSIKQRILTWDDLHKHSLSGPDRCGLCTINLENVNHIFGGCTFFQSVWEIMCNYFSITVSWDKQNMHEKFEFIVKNYFIQIDVLIATLWEVWRMRNNVIFQNGRLDHYQIRMSAIGWVHSYASLDQLEPTRRTITPLADQHGIVGYFNGTEQGGYCGVGMIIRINQTSIFRLKLSIGPRSNTKDELLALWSLLYFSKENDIQLDSIFRDSKAIIVMERNSYGLGYHNKQVDSKNQSFPI